MSMQINKIDMLFVESNKYKYLKNKYNFQAPTTVTTTPTATPISTHQQQHIVPTSTTLVNSNQTISTGAPIVTQTTPKQSLDNTKEKCRKFLANLLELSSREPKNVEKNVRTLIQELIDMKVEPEEFCDRLERLLNASPQPCLIGFLKVRYIFDYYFRTETS